MKTFDGPDRNLIESVDPELRAPLIAWYEQTEGGLQLTDIAATRRLMDGLAAAQSARAKARDDVRCATHHRAVRTGFPPVGVRVYEPTSKTGLLPGLVWIHGGGYVLGSAANDDLLARHLCRAGECVVVSVDYRLAPEHPYPAPLEDCYTALVWLAENATDLGVDPQRISIGGASAGGGLAAGLALLARDRGEVELEWQMLIYPMLDDRTAASQPAGSSAPDALVWSQASNAIGWQAYLGREPGAAAVAPYAAPARAEDLSGLPPTYLPVADLDLFLDENIDYARRLMMAGVAVELHVYPGGFHGFNGFFPKAALSRRFNADRDAAMRRMLHASDDSPAP